MACVVGYTISVYFSLQIQRRMAGRRGFGARSREDLFAEAESISQTLAHRKRMGRAGEGGISRGI